MKIQTIAVLVDLENPMEWLFTFFVLFCFFGLLGGSNSNSLNQVISMNNTKTITTTKKTLKEHQTHTDKNRKKKEEIGKFKI